MSQDVGLRLPGKSRTPVTAAQYLFEPRDTDRYIATKRCLRVECHRYRFIDAGAPGHDQLRKDPSGPNFLALVTVTIFQTCTEIEPADLARPSHGLRAQICSTDATVWDCRDGVPDPVNPGPEGGTRSPRSRHAAPQKEDLPGRSDGRPLM
ncbi:hypothetical protein N657DRAFT_632230 [Parathielavia appendiculata]|uniref:Uncharacterized protein n=1 Tax=Parathielavia appendiculata TaxID=2587402 RepID=A0AAN6U465_9PEZI|nr:hypothetical protein N657DRAFT_632230 [Parathielavia appendiculata]